MSLNMLKNLQQVRVDYLLERKGWCALVEYFWRKTWCKKRVEQQKLSHQKKKSQLGYKGSKERLTVEAYSNVPLKSLTRTSYDRKCEKFACI